MYGGNPAGMRRCIRYWFVALASLLGILAAWLFVIQVLLHPALAKEAQKLQRVKADLLGARGSIYDRNGVPLAISRVCYSIFVDPGKVDPKQDPVGKLAPIVKLPASEVAAAIAHPGRFCWLVRRADDQTVARVRALCQARRLAGGKLVRGLSGVGFLPEKQRLYPYGELAGQTVGLVRDDNTGGAGIEGAYDKVLGAQDGYLLAEVDGSNHRRVIPGRRLAQVEPKRGRDLYLTLDVRIQEMAEAALRQGVEDCHATAGTAIVIDPMTGEVLALAVYPSADPNQYRSYPKERWRNPAVTCVYEPGSTFKLVAACAALEYGGRTPDSPVVTCTGSKVIGNRTIHCALHAGSRAHGTLDLHGVIVKSCNIGAATLALSLGPETFYKMLRGLGFAQRTNIGLPGEAAGSVPPPQTWKNIRLANLGFGQGITVTAPQLLAAYSAVAADGVLPALHVVDRIARENGAPEKLHYQGRRVLSERTARAMVSILSDVVTEGTGKAAQVDGFTIAGKTGTAQKPIPGKGYKSGKYIGSFVGFAPAEDPRVAILVIMDEPQGSHYGGVVAAPVFRELARRSLAYLGMPPRLLAQASDAQPEPGHLW